MIFIHAQLVSHITNDSILCIACRNQIVQNARHTAG